MSMIDAEDIAAMKDSKKELLELHDEWEKKIKELSDNEKKLYEYKEVYQALSDKIIEETNFKELYGKNNAEVRKNHVKNELSGQYQMIKDLEFRIDFITRRIVYLKELIRTKRLLMELRE